MKGGAYNKMSYSDTSRIGYLMLVASVGVAIQASAASETTAKR